MLVITADLMAAATNCGRGAAQTWAKPLAEACALYDITTKHRLAAFLAQVGHESGGFARTVENLNYRAEGLVRTWPARFSGASAQLYAHQPEKIANHVYGGRMGNKEPGDGYRYRGRGLMQVTGRANYEAVRDQLRERVQCVPDLLVLPETLAEPKWAALSAAAYWHDHNLNELADRGAFDMITRRINGGDTGGDDRRARHARARKALA